MSTPSKNIPHWMKEAFQIIDRKDAQSFAKLISNDGIMRFGNGPVMKGREEIATSVANFFSSLESLSHTLERAWVQDDAQCLQGLVKYTRKDGKVFDIPFTDVFVMGKNGEVAEWLVYSDMTPLFS